MHRLSEIGNFGAKLVKIIDMAKKILTKHGEIAKIAQLMGVTPKTVYNALNYQTESAQNRKIRQFAIHRGGVEIDV